MKFKLLNLGQQSKIFVNNVLAQINTYYEKEDTIRIEKINDDHIGEPFDTIQYQGFHDTSKGEIKSNIAKIIVNFPPDKSVTPSSVNNEIEILNTDQINIFDNITYNEAVDRAKIISFESIGDLTFNSGYIFENKELLQYDFSKLKFKPLETGIGFPYQEIKYQVGNVLGYNSTIYSLKINIEGLASLIEIEEPDIQEFEGSKSIIYTLGIENGVVNKTAKIQIETSLPPEVFENEDSTVRLAYRNNSFLITENGTIDFTTTLDIRGQDQLLLEIDLFLENNNIEGFVKFTLLEIDEESSLVSATNQQTLTLISI